MSRPFASPIPENSRKKRANIYDPLPVIPTRTTRSQSSTREQVFPQPAVTPTRSSSSTSDENIDPSATIYRIPSMASQESTQSSSKGISHNDLNDFYCKITDKFANSLESITRHISTNNSSATQTSSQGSTAHDSSPAAFLKAFPSVWSPLSLKSPPSVLLSRLEAIWELSNRDFKLAKRNILMLLDEESQLAVALAHDAISTKEDVKQWTNAILSIHGPKLHSVYKQVIDPIPFRDESWLQFATRLTVHTARCDKHPCPDLALTRLQCLLRSYAEFFSIQSAKSWEDALDDMGTICINHLTTTGQELRPRSKQQSSVSTTSPPPQPTPASTTPPNNCSHCGKKGHLAERCWKRDPSLREKFRKNANVAQIHATQQSTSSRQPEGSQSSQPSPLPHRPDLHASAGTSIPELCNKLIQHLRTSKTSVPNGDIIDGLNFSQSALLDLPRERITPVYEDAAECDLPQSLGELFSIFSSSTSPPPQRPERTFLLPRRMSVLTLAQPWRC